MTIKTEVLNEDGFATAKKVLIEIHSGEIIFETPAPVYVPYLDTNEFKAAGKNDPCDLTVSEELLSFFPLVNVLGTSHFPENGHSSMIFIDRMRTENGETREISSTKLFRSDDIVYPGGITGDEPGMGISIFSLPYSSTEGGRSAPHIVAVNGLSGLSEKPRRLLSFTSHIHASYDREDLFYAPGVADPYNVPYLAYLGFDLFDTVKAARDAALSIYWGDLAGISLEKIRKEYLSSCNCHGCKELLDALFGNDEAPYELSNIVGPQLIRITKALFIHNSLKLVRSIAEVRRIIPDGSLYLHAHAYSVTNWAAFTALRLFYRECRAELMEGTPRVAERVLLITQREMMDHPDIVGFGMRLKETYVPPKRDVLLLLPCSHRKPYSSSRTHKAMNRVIKNHSLRWNIHSVVITSPLGIVPIELENCYPAKNYDIPVTGDWDEFERGRVDELLDHLINAGNYDYAVAHLGDENFLADDLLKKHFQFSAFTSGDPTSSDSLRELSAVLNEIKEKMMEGGAFRKKKENRRRGHVPFDTRDEWGILTFQFDADIAERLTVNTKLKGRWPAYSIIDGASGAQIARFVPKRGMFSLGKGAGKRLEGVEKNRVFIGDFKAKGTIFCVGIDDADRNIRPMDEVLIYHGGELRGVGRAMASGKAMAERRRGPGVKVRHTF